MAWVFTVVEGSDQGRRFAFTPGSFRVIGRQDGVITGTQAVMRSAVRRLEDEDHDRMAQHLAKRATPGLFGARGATADFERDDDIDLGDDAVSQTHAMVFCDEAGLSIVDVASKNGTWINGDRVHESTIVDGDLVRVGETRLSMKLEP
ncbi:MAG: FHA domain-containing protein [Deltaproteobacteria bacterium]|nr:FHA domain-containing protein [Deltaproteobacteria bacterium]